MASHKIQVTEPVKQILRFMNPNERSLVVGVFRLLGDEVRRDAGKFDLCIPNPDAKRTWGFAEGQVWVGFVEEDDGTITIIHTSILSKFRR